MTEDGRERAAEITEHRNVTGPGRQRSCDSERSSARPDVSKLVVISDERLQP